MFPLMTKIGHSAVAAVFVVAVAIDIVIILWLSGVLLLVPAAGVVVVVPASQPSNIVVVVVVFVVVLAAVIVDVAITDPGYKMRHSRSFSHLGAMRCDACWCVLALTLTVWLITSRGVRYDTVTGTNQYVPLLYYVR